MSEAAHLPLEPCAEATLGLYEAAKERLVVFARGIEAQRVFAAGDASAFAALLAAELPERGIPIPAALDTLISAASSAGLNTASGGHMGFVPGGGLCSGAVAAWIAATVNPFVGSALASPGAVAVEAASLRWLREFLRLPPHFDGVLTSGGSLAALNAFVAAREARPSCDVRVCCAYFSAQAHFSIARAARVSGIPRTNLRSVRCLPCGAMDTAHLRTLLRQDRALGKTPLLLCASAGTATLGVIDPIAELASVAAEEEMWFHLDAAYGGAFCSLPENAKLFDGMAQADSIVVDPHKGLFASYGVGALFVKDGRRLKQAFAPFAESSASDESTDAPDILPNYFEKGLELSRDWRGARLWLPFALHGAEAFRAALRSRQAWAQALWHSLKEVEGLRLSPFPELSLFGFRLHCAGLTREESDAVNRALLESINASGRIFLTGTNLEDGYFIRVCVLHLRTDAARVDEACQIILENVRAARAWLAQHQSTA